MIRSLLSALLVLWPIELLACRVPPSVNAAKGSGVGVPLCKRFRQYCTGRIGAITVEHRRPTLSLNNSFEHEFKYKTTKVTIPSCKSYKQFCESKSGVTFAWYALPTDIYPHGVLGDDIEYQRLSAYTDNSGSSCGHKSIDLDDQHVFEDIAPRFADFDGDGEHEIITVRSHIHFGAQIAIWKDNKILKDKRDYIRLHLLATTPYIGTRFRWLAPAGIADFNGDGDMDIAYVDRPHLAKTLRIATYRNRELVEIATIDGLSNHRIGEDFISGGIRQCGSNPPEIITADANWQNIMSTQFGNDELVSKIIGPFMGRKSLDSALEC